MNLSEAFDGPEADGVVTLSGGEIGFSTIRRESDGTFSLRYESGWWVTHLADGVRPIAGYIYRKDGSVDAVPGGDRRNIVAFEPMPYETAMAKAVACGFHP